MPKRARNVPKASSAPPDAIGYDAETSPMATATAGGDAKRGRFDTSKCKPCAEPTCNSLAKIDCVHDCCVKCCARLGGGDNCPSHRNLIRRKEEDNRLLMLRQQPAAAKQQQAAPSADAAAAAHGGDETSGAVAAAFSRPQKPTITVFCLADFVNTRAFSLDLLVAQERTRRLHGTTLPVAPAAGVSKPRGRELRWLRTAAALRKSLDISATAASASSAVDGMPTAATASAAKASGRRASPRKS